MSMRKRAALGAARTLAWVNALMAAGMALAGGAFVFGSLGCGGMVEPGVPMALEDSLALEKVLQANGLKVSDIRYATGVASDGRVTHLSLYDKGITTLPAEIGALDRMESLQLSRNGLKALPKDMEKLISLVSLYLNWNALESLPDGLRFEALRIAELRGNRLTALPGNFDVTSVRQLDLGDNQLASLPPDFRFLHRLNSLKLDGNRLDSLGVDFSLMEDLDYLNLSRNRLKALPPSLADRDPAFLDVGHNQLCFHLRADADSATARMIAWLDAKDRDWRETQTCP